MSKNVAILLTGKHDIFHCIEHRLHQLFKSDENINYVFFAHRWLDDFKNINPTEIIKHDDITKYVYIKPLQNVGNYIVNTIESSYIEPINILNEKPDYKLTSKMLCISYLSQAISTHYAFKACNNFHNNNTIDYVVKWRYDLLSESINNYAFNEIEKNTIYTNYVTDKIMNDLFYIADYNTFSLLMSNYVEKMKQQLFKIFDIATYGTHDEKNVLKSDDIIFYYEHMLKNIVSDAGLLVNKISFSRKDTIVRTPELATATIQEIIDYNKNKWINKGWEHRILM